MWHGVIEDIQNDVVVIRLVVEGEEYNAEFAKETIVKNQQSQIQIGRYVGMHTLRPRKLHVCTCTWTKEDIALAEERAKEFTALLTEIQSLPSPDQ